MTETRDPSIDALRGLAIVTMVAANMAPYLLRPPHPMAFRIVGSFAAPTFVFLAGMMVGGARRSANVRHALRRGAVLLAVAAGIDVVCWHIPPFVGVDVLYLIGIALPVAALCRALEPSVHALLAVVILGITPLLREHAGYGPLLAAAEPWPLWRRWLVDGWFPLFPWLGVVLLGSFTSRMRKATTPRAQLVLGAALTLVGAIALFVRRPVLVTRGGYSELFYPPTLPSLCVAIGTFFLVLASLPFVRRNVPLAWLDIYGRASLVLYVAHTVLIAFVLNVFFGPQRLPGFFALYAGHMTLLWGVAWMTKRHGDRASRDGSRSYL